MQLISASVPKRNAPSGVANGQNELLFSTVRERTEAQFSRFAGGKLALVSDPERFALCGLPIVKVGINFDSEKHTLTDWEIRKESFTSKTSTI